jgi:tetratricopeptide (TPR) repeat protein
MSDDPLLQAELLAALAPLEAMLGHLSEASELLAQARETTDALGEWIWIASFWRAFIALWNDDPVEAERELLPAYEALRRIGEKSHFSSIAHALSNALYAQGRYEEAERLTHECEEASGPNDVHSQINWRAIRAKTLARRGETEAAERLAREAVAYAEASDFLLAHADALADLAEVLTLRDGREAAAAAFRQSIDLHARKGNLLGVERIRVRLVELLA